MKNPFLSAWLSAANRAAGWWRGKAMVEAKRQQGRALRALLAPKRPKPKRRKS